MSTKKRGYDLDLQSYPLSMMILHWKIPLSFIFVNMSPLLQITRPIDVPFYAEQVFHSWL